jgi:hypothetical protein
VCHRAAKEEVVVDERSHALTVSVSGKCTGSSLGTRRWMMARAAR